MNEIINLGNGQFVKVMMLKGEQGDNIASIVKTGTSGLEDTYTITLTDGSTSTFTVTNGSSIQSINKTGTSGLVDTYTITLTNGNTFTFEVTNGTNGSNSNLADIIPSLVATQDYAVNDHVIWEETYYIVTQPIHRGDDIIIVIEVMTLLLAPMLKGARLVMKSALLRILELRMVFYFSQEQV